MSSRCCNSVKVDSRGTSACCRCSRYPRTACWKTRPITEAVCSVYLSSAGSRSMRAAITPCRVSGTSSCEMDWVATAWSPSSRTMPESINDRSSSSRKKGLPSDLLRISCWVASGMFSIFNKFSTSKILSAGVSGAISMTR